VTDLDDITLTYRLLRGPTNVVVASTTASSTFWNRPTITLTDTTAPSGTSQTYRIEVFDGNNTVRGGFSRSRPGALRPASAQRCRFVAGTVGRTRRGRRQVVLVTRRGVLAG
jgi:hypothetical protein